MKTKEHSGHDTGQAGTMRIVRINAGLNRRRFLTGSGLASIGVSVLGAGTLLSGAGDALAQSFSAFGPDAGRLLLRMARDIFPHDKLAEKFYLHAIAPYEQAAAADPALKKLFCEGLAQLNAAAETMRARPYLDIAAEPDRVAVLKSIESTPFFQRIKGDLVTGLYNNQGVFAQFGYEGSSWQHGGYLHRGFDDIDWL